MIIPSNLTHQKDSTLLGSLSSRETTKYSFLLATVITALMILIPLISPQKFEKIYNSNFQKEKQTEYYKIPSFFNNQTGILEFIHLEKDVLQKDTSIQKKDLMIGIIVQKSSRWIFDSYLYIYFKKNGKILKPSQEYKLQKYLNISVYALSENVNQKGQLVYKKVKTMVYNEKTETDRLQKTHQFAHFQLTDQKVIFISVDFTKFHKRNPEIIPQLRVQRISQKYSKFYMLTRLPIFLANIIIVIVCNIKNNKFIFQLFLLNILIYSNPLDFYKAAINKSLKLQVDIFLWLLLFWSLHNSLYKNDKTMYYILSCIGVAFDAISSLFVYMNGDYILQQTKMLEITQDLVQIGHAITVWFIIVILIWLLIVGESQDGMFFVDQSRRNKLFKLFLPFILYSVWLLGMRIIQNSEFHGGLQSLEYLMVLNFQIWFILWLVSTKLTKDIDLNLTSQEHFNPAQKNKLISLAAGVTTINLNTNQSITQNISQEDQAIMNQSQYNNFVSKAAGIIPKQK